MVNDWIGKASYPDEVEVIIAVDADDEESIKSANEAIKGLKAANVLVQDKMPGTAVKGWNLAAKGSSGTVLIAMSDDFEAPKMWDDKIWGIRRTEWMKKPKVVLVNDGYLGDLCTLAIVTRSWYEARGYLFYPGYESIYSDTELTHHAQCTGALLLATHLLFPHHHPDNRRCHRPIDKVDKVHSSKARYKRGKVLFEQRQALGFPYDL